MTNVLRFQKPCGGSHRKLITPVLSTGKNSENASYLSAAYERITDITSAHATLNRTTSFPVSSPSGSLYRQTVLLMMAEGGKTDELTAALRDLGSVVMGPFGTVVMANEAITNADFSVAVLDVRIGVELVFELADQLYDFGLPFIFLTDYGDVVIPMRARQAVRVANEMSVDVLVGALELAYSNHDGWR